jgi:hypothetical protein
MRFSDGFDEPGYRYIERKPWNVRIGDIIVLEDMTQGLLTQYIPVRITHISTNRTFERRLFTNEIARTEWEFLHEPVNPDDKKYLYNWWTTRWNRFNSVDLYRRVEK